MRKAALLLLGIVWTSTACGVDVQGFLGRWALYLPNGAGWLEVRQEKGYLDADILWYGGSVVPVSAVYLEGDALVVEQGRRQVRRRGTDGKPTRSHTLVRRINLKKKGEKQLVARAVTPNRDGLGVQVTEFTAKKTPPLPTAPNLAHQKYGPAVTLFNGKDLTGWRLTNPNAKNGFKAREGVLVNDPIKQPGRPRVHYGNIRTDREFEDFRLTLEVNVPKGSNSGIYLRGIYEVQVSDTQGRGLDSHHMGAIYSRITPSQAAEKPAGQWQSLDMTLCDRHATVILNGKTIVDNQPLLGVTGGALSADQFSPGPIYLQGDHGKVMFRNLVLHPIIK